MQDAIIAGTGNSRYLRSISDFLTQYPTYSDFAAALVNGTLPIDLNGINDSGFTVVGTPLDKATLLDDQTSEAISAMLTSYAASPDTPNEAMALLTQIVGENIQLETLAYSGNGNYGQSSPNTITFTRRPKMVWIWATSNSTAMEVTLRSPFVYKSFGKVASEYYYGDDFQEILYTWNENTLSWYATTDTYQFNTSGASYSVLAICGAPLKILSQPKSVTAPLGTTVYFKVIAAGTGLRYQWQYRTGSSGSWNNSPASGNTTNCLTVPATSDRNGNQYRCRIRDDSSSSWLINTNAATLTVTS